MVSRIKRIFHVLQLNPGRTGRPYRHSDDPGDPAHSRGNRRR